MNITAEGLLPVGAPVVLRINNFNAFASVVDSSQIELLQGLPLDDLRTLGIAQWTGALTTSGAQKLDWIWSTSKTPTGIDAAERYAFNEHTLYKLGPFVAFEQQGKWAVSLSEPVIKDAINQLDQGVSLLDNAEFYKLWKNASASDAVNVFVQHKGTHPMGEVFFQSDATWMEHFASWSEVDIAVRNSRVLFTSVSLCSDSTNSFLSTFDSKPNSTSVSEIVANSAQFALVMRTGAPVQWLRKFNVYRGKQQRQKHANRLLTDMGIDAATAALEFEGTFARIGFGNEVILACRLSNENDVAALLAPRSESTSTLLGRPAGVLKAEHKHLFTALFGWFFTDLDVPHWTVQKEWLYLAPNAQLLEVYTNELKLGKSWENTAQLEQLARAIDREEHFCVALPLAANAGKFGLPTPLPTALGASIAWGTLEVKEDLGFGNLTIETLQAGEDETEATASYLWSTPLDAPVIKGPYLVNNHRSGKQNVVVQDETHHLYWLDDEGALQWKVALDGPIIGTVQQVDLYKNNKYQLVFSTANKLYCLDVLGRSVENFPATLPAATTTGVSVVDYDKNRNYRFLVAAGSKLYNYSGSGKQVEGWKTDAASEALIQAPVLHQRGGKDYILTSTATQAYVLNRRGEPRLSTKAMGAGGAWSMLDGTPPSAARVSEAGLLQLQRLDGTTDEVSDPLGELKGLCSTPYGTLYWTEDELELRSDETALSYDFDEPISAIEAYPGGTGIVFHPNEQITVLYLKSMEKLSTFVGNSAVAGRFSATGQPVFVVGQHSSVVAYRL